MKACSSSRTFPSCFCYHGELRSKRKTKTPPSPSLVLLGKAAPWRSGLQPKRFGKRQQSIKSSFGLGRCSFAPSSPMASDRSSPKSRLPLIECNYCKSSYVLSFKSLRVCDVFLHEGPLGSLGSSVGLFLGSSVGLLGGGLEFGSLEAVIGINSRDWREHTRIRGIGSTFHVEV